MLFSTVNARASTARAEEFASESVWTLTLLKLWPKRGSIKASVALPNGAPGERSASCTIRGATAGVFARPALRCMVFFLLHSSQSPAPDDPPQEHLRRSVAPGLAGAKEGPSLFREHISLIASLSFPLR